MRYIVYRNAWGDGIQAETSIVPELCYPFGEMKSRCREKLGVEFITLDQVNEGMDILAAFFIDPPPVDDPLLKMWVHRGIPHLFLMVCENLFLQPNKTYAGVAPFARTIFSYEMRPPMPEKTVRLRYPADVRGGMEARAAGQYVRRPYQVGMISSCKFQQMPGELYSKRYHYSYTFLDALGEAFALWGHGWPHGGKGPLPCGPEAKHAAYRQCEFALVMENCRSIPGYITEKVFNALIAGCLPIYEYCDTAEGADIPKDCFVNAAAFQNPMECLEFINSMKQEEKTAMFNAGTSFLASKEVEKYSVENYVKTIYQEIAAIV